MVRAKKETATTQPDPQSLDLLVQQHVSDIALLETYAADLIIGDTPTFEQAASGVQQVAAMVDRVEAQRKELTGPILAAKKNIDGKFSPIVKALEKIEASLKEKIGAYTQAEQAQRNQLLLEAQQAAELGEGMIHAESIVRAENHLPPKADGVSVSLVWTGYVVDASLIPAIYMVPDVAQLEAVTRAANRDPQIPGWCARQEPHVRTSRKG